MANRAIIAIFAKPPVPGTAKTRLAASVGPARAAGLARAFLADTWTSVSSLGWARAVVATTDGKPRDFALPGTPDLWLQGDGDLGQRIERIVQRGLGEADVVLAIGADTPGLPQRLLVDAREQLTRNDAVLGPSYDGGFYLIGLRRCPRGLFEHLPWSSTDTFSAMKARLESAGMRTAVLEPWFDVDRPDDLQRLRAAIQHGEICAPATQMALTGSTRVSVVIPVLNEDGRIGRQLESLHHIPGIHEVIVVDGGSEDRTLEVVRAHEHVRPLTSARGRAAQMNAGARIATGEVLVFLHADVQLPADAVAWIEDALADEEVVAGAFRTWTVPEQQTRLGPLLHLADVRSRYTSLPYGDQALFVRANVFRELGGFPDQPLMEDLELSRRLRTVGRIRTVPVSVRVSGRRFVARPVFYTLLVNIFPLLYRLGVSPRAMASLYGDQR